MPSKIKPDTTIPCAACVGTGKNPRFGHECGACFGFGLSTVSYDQRRNGTTITLWEGEVLDPKYTQHSANPTYKMVEKKRVNGTIMNISWVNQNYRGQ